MGILCVAAESLALAVGVVQAPGGEVVAGLLLPGDIACGLTLPLFTLLDWKRLSGQERALGLIVGMLCLASAAMLCAFSGG